MPTIKPKKDPENDSDIVSGLVPKPLIKYNTLIRIRMPPINLKEINFTEN